MAIQRFIPLCLLCLALPAWAAPEPLAPLDAAPESYFNDALVAAYTANPRILAERERQKATDEDISQALSGFRPTANGTFEKGRQRTAFGGAPRSYGDAESKSLTVDQPLFRGGATIAGYQAAKQRVKAGQARLSAVEQEVLFQAAQAYMNVVQAQSILALSRNNEEVLKKQLKAAQERFDVGEVTRTDVAQSEARLSNATAQVIQSEGELISATAAYERVVGSKPEALLSSPENMPELPGSLTEALTIAREENPGWLEAFHAEKSAKYDVRGNMARLLPQVSLRGQMSRDEGAGVNGNSDFDQDSLKINVSIPLYQGGAEYSRIRESKAVERQRGQQRADARQLVDEQVTQAWERLETALATIRAREDQIKAAEVALDGVRMEQEYGARTVLDVLDAEQELFLARSNLVRAESTRTVAVYNLLLSLGKLTPENLKLETAQYEPQENYEDIKWLPAGF